jgi:thiol:disulfide interchange protein DsbC
MLKKMMGVLLAGIFALQASADEASLKKTIETTFPRVKVQSIAKTPFNGLYEVYFDGQIIYTDENFTFLLADGRLVDTKTRKDLTAERLETLTRVDVHTLPLDQAVKVVKGDGSRKLVVFSDPDCPYCKKLEQKELIGINNVTIYTFLYPLEGLHPDAGNKSRAIWCAPDRSKAWQEWALKGVLPKGEASCDTPIEEIAVLGRKLGITSTPTLIFADGKRMMGAYPAKDIEKALGTAAARK